MEKISVSDLSVGDWVRVINQFDAQIYGYHCESGSLSLKTRQGNLVYYRLEDITPIPLTPEILGKNGFEIVDESADFQLYGSPECSIFFTKGTVRYRLETPQASVVCWNVHQIQHALRLAGVGKEIVL